MLSQTAFFWRGLRSHTCTILSNPSVLGYQRLHAEIAQVDRSYHTTCQIDGPPDTPFKTLKPKKLRRRHYARRLSRKQAVDSLSNPKATEPTSTSDTPGHEVDRVERQRETRASVSEQLLRSPIDLDVSSNEKVLGDQEKKTSCFPEKQQESTYSITVQPISIDNTFTIHRTATTTRERINRAVVAFSSTIKAQKYNKYPRTTRDSPVDRGLLLNHGIVQKVSINRVEPLAATPESFLHILSRPGRIEAASSQAIPSTTITGIESSRVRHGIKILGRPSTVVFRDYQGANSRFRPIKVGTQTDKPQSILKMKSWVQFLTTPTADTPGTTLLLHFDTKRYLIGHVSEGTQRACVQRKTALMKVEDIFLTGKVNWETTGGILGMILTLADSKSSSAASSTNSKSITTGHGKNRLRLHGGNNLTHLLATARRFVFRKGMPLDVNEIKERRPHQDGPLLPTFEDENIKCWAMAIKKDFRPMSPRKRSHKDISGDNSPTMQEDEEDKDDQVRKGVVGHMFDSVWKMDSLITMKLSEVKLPAKLFIRNEGKIEKYEGPLPGGSEPLPEVDVLVRRPWPGALVDALPTTTPSETSMSYIIKNHPQRGKFNVAAAAELKVKKGEKYKLLASGQSVLSEDGKTITPDMVLAPGKEGGGFAVLDIPDKSFIDATLAREELASETIMKNVELIVWILGKGVYGDKRLSKYMANTKIEHIISGYDTSPNRLALESPASAAIRLNMLDSERFPIPVHNNNATLALETQERVRSARVGQKVDLEPAFKISEDSSIGLLDTGVVIQEMPSDILKLAQEAREKVEAPEYLAKLADLQEDLLCKDAEVITLGTGSALPSKYRNVSATLLRIPEYGNYLFDCGENTLGQLKRVFGDELQQVLKNLKVLWISHLHADHHLGTASVIREWHQATKDDPESKENKLLVASAPGMLRWLSEYAEVEDFGYHRLMLENLAYNSDLHLRKYMSEYQISEFNLMSIEAVRVNHCHDALAVVFEWPNGFKVAYSGDCRPSNEFAKAGKGVTLLIHEATFDDELRGDALAKKHSTTSEALNIGLRMEARRILLTHFSQRYQKIPVMGNTSGHDQVAIVAFDYMKCKIGDFAKLAEFRPALLKLYEDREE